MTDLARLARLSPADRELELALERGVALAESLASEPDYAGDPDAIAAEVARQIPELVAGPRCESGWTGDRCTYSLGHEGDHSNETADRTAEEDPA